MGSTLSSNRKHFIWTHLLIRKIIRTETKFDDIRLLNFNIIICRQFEILRTLKSRRKIKKGMNDF